jgi:hypothetical protein
VHEEEEKEEVWLDIKDGNFSPLELTFEGIGKVGNF